MCVSGRVGGGGRRIRPCSLGERGCVGGGGLRRGRGSGAWFLGIYMYVCVWAVGVSVCGCVGGWIDVQGARPVGRAVSQVGCIGWSWLYAVRGRQAGRQLGVGMTWARDPAFSYSHGHSLFVMPHFATPPQCQKHTQAGTWEKVFLLHALAGGLVGGRVERGLCCAVIVQPQVADRPPRKRVSSATGFARRNCL